MVVNCFQIIVSLTSDTTKGDKRVLLVWLWIAFKLLYLWHLTQLIVHSFLFPICCELLSNYCIFDIWHNLLIGLMMMYMLWIAFKLLYLWHLTQPQSNTLQLLTGCELLSNYCIFDIWHNPSSHFALQQCVVNCFQIIVSLTSDTTDLNHH